MKIKSKSILNIILALNLIFPIGYINNIDSYATVIDENEIIDKWETKTPMPTIRGYFTSEVVNGKIYCIGGYNNGTYYNKVEVYDPATDTWETKTPMPTSRDVLTSAVVNGKIYCIGGEIGNSTCTNKVEVYDPATDTWETKTSMPTTRGYLTSSVVNGKIYCIGGWDDYTYYNKVEVYDPATDTWETKTPMPASRYVLTSAVVNGKIYCIGGEIGYSTCTNKVEVYDPATDTWKTKTSMPTSRGYLTGEVVNGKIYCIGGYDGSSCLNTVEVYDPETDTWETKTSMPSIRDGLISEVVNGKIYCIGGTNDSFYLNTVEVYTPNINTPEYRAEQVVISAENSRDTVDIETARNLVNQLEESELKNDLQNRLNAIVPDLTLDIKNATTNVDVYIKSENMLSLSLDTNSIMFGDFSGVDDIEKLNAINLTVSSSLPYKVNAYLASEMQNSDKSNTMDKDILNIKANSETAYNTFTDTITPIVLLDNQQKGNDMVHGIDIKLKSGVAHKKDVYKTTIKIEIEQK